MFTMHRSISGHNPYTLFILTVDYSKNFTTMQSLTIEHMALFVVKSIYIQIKWSGYGSVIIVLLLSLWVLTCAYDLCV